MSLPANDHRELDAALKILNEVQTPEDLADRVQLHLRSIHRRPSRFLQWRPLLLSPMALAVIILAWFTIGRQAAPWRPVAPRAIVTQAPRRTVNLPDSVAALPRLRGGRRAAPAQPQPFRTARTLPPAPFVYPQSREMQLRMQSASEARVTDPTLFDPRSDVEVSDPDVPK